MKVTKISYDQSEIVVTINALFKALQHVYPPHGGSGVARLAPNGINSVSATNVGGVVSSV